MNEQELVQFLKENLKVNVWCDYHNFNDGRGDPQVNVNISICDEEICSSSDYLLPVH